MMSEFIEGYRSNFFQIVTLRNVCDMLLYGGTCVIDCAVNHSVKSVSGLDACTSDRQIRHVNLKLLQNDVLQLQHSFHQSIVIDSRHAYQKRFCPATHSPPASML